MFASILSYLYSSHPVIPLPDVGSLSDCVSTRTSKRLSLLVEAPVLLLSPLALQYIWIMDSTARNATEIISNM